MATLREFILAQSFLPTGNTVRDHIQNPGAFDYLILTDGLDVEVDMGCFDVEITLDLDYEVEVETQEFDVEIDTNEYEVEICDG